MACAAHMMPTSAAAQLGVKRRAVRCRHKKRQRSWRCRMKTGVSEHTPLISSRGGNHFPANCISAKPRTTRTHCHQPDRARDLSQILVPNPPVQITAIDGKSSGRMEEPYSGGETPGPSRAAPGCRTCHPQTSIIGGRALGESVFLLDETQRE